MEKNQFDYGVLLPRELRDRLINPGNKMISARFPIVAIDITTAKDPTGVGKGTKLSNPRDDEDPYAGLVFRGYLSWATGQVESIGCELEYSDLFSVDLSRAERMLRLLRRIRAVQSQFPVRPSGLGQYIALLGPAVGIKYLVMAEDDETERRNSYPDGWYRIASIREAETYVGHLIQGIREKYLSECPAHA